MEHNSNMILGARLMGRTLGCYNNLSCSVSPANSDTIIITWIVIVQLVELIQKNTTLTLTAHWASLLFTPLKYLNIIQ